MSFVRNLWLPVAAAALAACSGNLGGGQSTLPGAPLGTTNNPQSVTGAVAAPTATPQSASNVASVGESVDPQPLPAVMGWGGTIAFPKPSAQPSASPNPKSSATPAPAAGPVSIGITASVIPPADAPALGATATNGRRPKHADPGAVTALLYISLLSTADVALGSYPRIAVEMPREIAAKHQNDTFGLALFDPAAKQKTYKLAVAERDLSSPAPGSAPPASAAPQPAMTATPGGPPNGSVAFTPPPVGTGLDAGTLPPEHVAFLGTVAPLTLKANRPVFFVIYALPPQPSPSPSASSPTSVPAAASPAGPTAAASASAAPSPAST